MASLCAYSFNSALLLSNSSFNFLHSSIDFSVGSIITPPVFPFNIMLKSLPLFDIDLISLIILPMPTTAGISKDLAIIEVWEVLPPISVIKPKVFSKFKFAVSEGVKSLATIIEFSGTSDNSNIFSPSKFLIHLSAISAKSPALSLKYSS